MSADDAYRNLNVWIHPLPEAVQRGSWWYRTWEVTAPTLDGIGEFSAPAPLDGLDAIITVVAVTGNIVRIELGAPDGDLSVDALTYVSMLVNELRCCLGPETAVDGDVNHNLFRLVKWDCER